LKLLKIEPLGKHHDRAAFSCGNPTIDRYLQQTARQASSRYEAATYVAVAPEEPTRIVGFFTLVGKEQPTSDLSEELVRALKLHPQRSYPCVLLAQLGIAAAAQGQGLGGQLMGAVLQKSVDIARSQGAIALITDPIDDNAKRFYQEKFGFTLMPSGERLVLPMRTIEELRKNEESGAVPDQESADEMRTDLANISTRASVLCDLVAKLNKNVPLSKQGPRQIFQVLDAIEREVTDLQAYKERRERSPQTLKEDEPPQA
jgi:GNAT superfamily N-acetyltransferase